MEQLNGSGRNKGGRPKKAVKRDQLMAFKCTLYERKIIEAKAKMCELLVSEYIRETIVNRQVDRRKKTLPPDILMQNGLLRQLAAYLNQIAKRRNSGEQLDALQRAELTLRSRDLKALADKIENHYQ